MLVSLLFSLLLQQQLQSWSTSAIGKILQRQCYHYNPLAMKTPLRLDDEYLHVFTTALPYRPDLSDDFPAQLVCVDMDWHDLVLPKAVLNQLDEIQG